MLVRTLKVALILFTAVVFSSNAVVAQQPEVTDYIPSSAFAAIDIKPKSMFQQPAMELIPHEIIKVFGEKELGLDLLEITRATVLLGEIDKENPGNPPEAGAIITFATPQTLAEKVVSRMVEGDPSGTNKFFTTADGSVVLTLVGDKTFIVGRSDFVRKMFSAKGADSRLIRLMNQADPADHINVYAVMEPVRDLIKQNLPPRNQLPPPFRDFLDLPDLIDTVSVRCDISENNVNELTINAVDDDATKKIMRLVDHGFALGKNAALSFLSMEANIPPDYQEPVMAYANRVATVLEKAVEPTVEGKELTFNLNHTGNGANLTSFATVGVMVGMLLPAVQQVREAARRTQAMNSMRQMLLACLNHESAYMHFPQDICDDDGNPLLSWRVAILPFIEQNELYEQFHLDEPWDSPHNIKLVEMMPPVYVSPNGNIPNGTTIFLGVAGENSMFQTNKKVTFAKITDGSSNTVAIIEVNPELATQWSRPSDWSFDPNAPMNGVGNTRPAVINCGFADGSTRAISRQIDESVWKNLMQINDGNIVRID